MAEIKRRFYNTGDYKGFTKKDFFEAVLALADGDELDDDVLDFVQAAAEYEIESIAIAAEKAAAKSGSGEKADPLHSDYANALRSAIVPLISGNPATLAQLQEAATAKGLVAPTGKPFSIPWIGRVLANEPGVVKTEIIVDKIDKNGLKSQVQATAYKKA